MTGRRGKSARRAVGVLLFGLAAGMTSEAGLADNFAIVYYAARKDQLVVTMFYRGTNPDHMFSLQWGQCQKRSDDRMSEIEATVLDSQWQDAAQRDFKKTTRFSLVELHCRPATLTLRTAPGFFYTLQIPAVNVQKP